MEKRNEKNCLISRKHVRLTYSITEQENTLRDFKQGTH